MFVHTAHGSGRVVDEQSVRGRKSFLVEGRGFKVWLDEKDLRVANDINEGNSTHLPYDPTPQHPTDMFASESTIQPIYEVDADERLHDADSLSFDGVADRPYPAPSPDNFARHADLHGSGDEFAPPAGYRGKHRPLPAPDGYGAWDSEDWMDAHPAPSYSHPRDQAAYEQHLNKIDSFGRELNDRNLHPFDPMHSEAEYPEMGQRGTIPVEELLNRMGGRESNPEYDFEDDDESEHDIKHFSYRQAGPAAGIAGMADAVKDAVDDDEDEPKSKGDKPSWAHPIQRMKNDAENLVDDFAGEQNKKQVGGWWPGRPDGQTVTSSLYERPAGLSDKYIRVEAHTDHYSNPVQQFRDDPIGFINKQAYIYAGSADIRLAEYVELVESDLGVRTAAWKDVRAKALRLRREGRVHVKDISPTQIYASVDGDSDTYDTMIVKSANNQSIDSWTCNCGWGSTVGQRKISYVGRLCSHGYASYLEMESQAMKGKGKRRKSAGVEEFLDPRADDWKKKKEEDYSDLPEGLRELIGPPYEEGRRHSSRTAGIVEDFKQWADNENDGMIDQNAVDNFIYLLNSQQDGDNTIVSEEDAEKLYEALDDMKSTGMVRDYDVDYLERPGDVYKEADILHLRPQSLTPDFYFVEDGEDGESWTDVEKDERKTTGPDNMVKKSWREGQEWTYAPENSFPEEYEEPEDPYDDQDMLRWLRDHGDNFYHSEDGNFAHERDVYPKKHGHKQSRHLTGRELHYASDEELFDAVKDWAGAGSKLEKLRSLSEQEPDYGNRRKQNYEIRQVVDELHDRGINASQFVASLRFAEDATADATAEDEEKKKAQPASTQGQPDMSGKDNQTGQPGGSSSVVKPDAGQNKSDPNTATNPTSTGGAGALSAQTSDPNGVGFGGYPARQGNPPKQGNPPMQSNPSQSDSSTGGGGEVGMNIMEALPSIMNTIGQVGSGIGSGISGIVNGLSGLGSIFASTDDQNRYAGEGFPNLHTTNHEPFAGSAPNPKYWMGSSECYVDDHERDRFVDVTDLDDDPIIKFTGDKPKQGPKKASRSRRPFVASENANPDGSTLTSGSSMNDSGISEGFEQVFKAGAAPQAWDGHRVRDFKHYVKQQGHDRPNHQVLQEYFNKPHRGLDQGGMQHLQDYTSHAEQHEASVHQAGFDDDGSDIVAQFHRMGGIEAINNSGGGSGGGSYSDSSIAERAQGFLRTAGRMYSLAEQRELEEEAHPKGARNLSDLDLRGTHYEDAL